MVDVRIVDLPQVTTPQPADFLPIEHFVGGSIFATSKITLADFLKITASIENRLINGDMLIDQHNEGASVTPPGTAYVVDQWRHATTQVSLLSYVQSTDAPVGFFKSLLITSVSSYALLATDSFVISNVVEGTTIADLAFGTASATSIILSFRAKASIAGTYAVYVQNGAANRSFVSTFVLAANTFTYVFVVVPGDTSGAWVKNNTSAMICGFNLGMGSNRQTATLNAWQTGNFRSTSGCVDLVSNASATLQITNVRLRAGTYDVGYVARPYGAELALAQRYFCKTLPAGVSVATAAAGTAGVSGAITIKNTTATDDPAEWWQFPVTMRANPTITTYNPSVANGNWRDITANTDVTVSVDPSATIGPSSVLIATLGTVAPLGDVLAIHATASCEL